VTRHERFAARALQGLLAARTNLDIKGEVGLAWRYAERMEAEAKRRELSMLAAERPADLPVTITVSYVFALALTEGYETATDAGLEFTNRERRVIREVLAAYGTAASAGELFYGRCELTQCWCEVAQFSFPAPAPRE
jgi:hypothetical protein